MFTEPMTRDVMITEIFTEWGLPDEPRGIDDIVYLNNIPDDIGWLELERRQWAREEAKRVAWLTNASVDWLPFVEDVIVHPPDFNALTGQYKLAMEDFWPYDELNEETWLYQIDGMLFEWKKKESEKVRPLAELVQQKLSRFHNG